MIIYRIMVHHSGKIPKNQIDMKTLTTFFKSCSIVFLSALILLLINPESSGQENLLTQQGHFYVGSNYWASHAGTHMWRDWNPGVVEDDFKLLSGNGIKVLRVFPLWPDFQPIHQIYSGGGSKKFIGFLDSPLPPAGPRSNGVS